MKDYEKNRIMGAPHEICYATTRAQKAVEKYMHEKSQEIGDIPVDLDNDVAVYLNKKSLSKEEFITVLNEGKMGAVSVVPIQRKAYIDLGNPSEGGSILKDVTYATYYLIAGKDGKPKKVFVENHTRNSHTPQEPFTKLEAYTANIVTAHERTEELRRLYPNIPVGMRMPNEGENVGRAYQDALKIAVYPFKVEPFKK